MAKLKTSDGIKIKYKHLGRELNKNPIVFIHGLGLDSTVFKEKSKYFKKEKHPVISVDLRGHGESDKGKKVKDHSLKRLVKDIEEVLAINKINKKIILVGYSLGGMIALKMAENNKQIKKLIIINSSDKAPDKNKFIKKFLKYSTLEKLANYIENKKINVNVKNEYDKQHRLIYFVKQIMKNNPYSMIEMIKTIYSKNKINARKIIAPTLILASTEDEFFSEKQAKKLSKKINKSIIKIYPEKHDLPLKKPKLIFQEIKQFIYTSDEYFAK